MWQQAWFSVVVRGSLCGVCRDRSQRAIENLLGVCVDMVRVEHRLSIWLCVNGSPVALGRELVPAPRPAWLALCSTVPMSLMGHALPSRLHGGWGCGYVNIAAVVHIPGFAPRYCAGCAVELLRTRLPATGSYRGSALSDMAMCSRRRASTRSTRNAGRVAVSSGCANWVTMCQPATLASSPGNSHSYMYCQTRCASDVPGFPCGRQDVPGVTWTGQIATSSPTGVPKPPHPAAGSSHVAQKHVDGRSSSQPAGAVVPNQRDTTSRIIQQARKDGDSVAAGAWVWARLLGGTRTHPTQPPRRCTAALATRLGVCWVRAHYIDLACVHHSPNDTTPFTSHARTSDRHPLPRPVPCDAD